MHRGIEVEAYVYCDVLKDGKILKVTGLYDGEFKMLQVDPAKTGRWKRYYHKNEFTLIPEEAIEKAQKIKDKKIISLEKKLSYISNLEITIEEDNHNV